MFAKKTLAATVAALAVLTMGNAVCVSPASAQYQHGPATQDQRGPDGHRDGDHHGDRHAALKRTMESLKAAQENLQSARSSYDGHRDRALALIQQAMDEVRAAFASDHH